MAGAVVALGLVGLPLTARAEDPGPDGVGSRLFEPVIEDVVRGDLLLAGNSNLVSAGGWHDPSTTAADVDGDPTTICATAGTGASRLLDLLLSARRVCADNSSSAGLDLPAGARVIDARLYVNTSLGADLGPLRVSIDGPGEDFTYQTLPADVPVTAGPPSTVASTTTSTSTTSTTTTTTSTTTTSTTTTTTTTTTPTPTPTSEATTVPPETTTTTTTIPAPAPPPEPQKLYEATGGTGDGAVLRQAAWDVTDYVAASGAGTYTVADIVNERAGAWLPYASWGIVVAYELDPAIGLDAIAPELQPRFAPRFVSWHDGFALVEAGSLEVPLGDLPPGAHAFAKSFHIVAHGRRGRSDNLIFGPGPLGNNATIGDSPPPPGVVIGTDPACNTVTDVQNDSICLLGTNVATKTPGATELVASADGVTTSSGSGVDMDVIRIPDRSLRGARPGTTLGVRSTGGDTLAPGMLAVSIDLAGVVP